MVDPHDAKAQPSAGGDAPSQVVLASGAATQIADRYDVLALLGSGGMGNVYRVLDRELDEVVALKFLRSELTRSAEALERFRREVRLARRVTHHNVARVFDIGEHHGEKYLTMEFIDGETLAQRLRREGALPIRLAVSLGLALCSGLGAAHTAGVIHRDLKPDNVMLEPAGRAVITDFGVARAAATHTSSGVIGTPAYMAPEQIHGAKGIDARADVYALGLVLFEIFVGKRAWPGNDAVTVLTRRLAEPPPDPQQHNPRLPDAITALLRRCMATQPGQRPQSTDEVAAALSEVAEPSASQHALSQPIAQSVNSQPKTQDGETLRSAARIDLPGPADTGVRTVAVLPFHNRGADDDDYLADELTDDLIDSLSSAQGLQVRPRRTVTADLARDADLTRLGKALNVQVIVEGSVRQRGSTVRVSARLLSVDQGLQLWAKRFDALAHQVLEINDQVAGAVIEALSGHSKAKARELPTNPKAVELLVRARQTLRRCWTGTGDLSQAVALFEQGLHFAPNDASLLSGYAMAVARSSNYATTGDDPRASARARAAAKRALHLQPASGESWLALATLHYTNSEWLDATAALRSALTHAANLSAAHEMLASIEQEVGQSEQAVARLRALLALDPSSEVALCSLPLSLELMGQKEQCDAALQAALSDSNARANAALQGSRLTLWRNTPVELPTPDETAASSPMQHLTELLRHVAATKIVTNETAQWFESAISATREGSRFRPVLLQVLAEAYGHVGDEEHTLATIERANLASLFDLPWLDSCPAIACVRNSPRFAAVRAEVADHAEAVTAALRAA